MEPKEKNSETDIRGGKQNFEPNVVVNQQNFEPDREVKNSWLNTRKKSRKYGAVELPGFFMTYGFTGDTLLVLLILGLEFWGLYNFMILLDSVIYTVALFFADAIFAIGSHLWSKQMCLAKNRLALAKFGIVYLAGGKTPKDETEIEKKSINNFRFYSSIFRVLIIFLALFKIASFMGNYSKGVNGLSITIMVTYILVALLHIRSTGYFLSELIRKSRFNSQYNTYLKSEDVSEYTVTTRREFNLVSRIADNYKKLNKLALQLNYTESEIKSLKFENVRTRHHVLENNIIHSFGILEDDDLHNLIANQKDVIQKEYLAIYGLIHQLEILEAPIARGRGNRSFEINAQEIPEINEIESTQI